MALSEEALWELIRELPVRVTAGFNGFRDLQWLLTRVEDELAMEERRRIVLKPWERVSLRRFSRLVGNLLKVR